MSLNDPTELIHSVKSSTHRLDLMTKELVDEDFSFAQVSGDQEKATGGEDTPQFDERPAKFMSSHMLDRVVGHGARERSRCKGECSHVRADGAQT